MPTSPLASTITDLRGFTDRLLNAKPATEVIYLVTTAGFPNYGDELITEAWLRLLAVRRPMARVIVDSPRPGQASLLLGHANRRAVFVDTLWQLVHFANGNADGHPDIDPDAPWDWVAHAASHLGVSPREDTGIAMLLNANMIHIVGGGYINSMWPHHVALVSAAAAVTERSGATAVATGAGLAPAVEGPALERMLADAARFDVFDVRDRPSEELLAGVPGLTRTGDDAWLSPRLPRRQTQQRTERVTLCAQSDLTESFVWDGRTGPDGLTAFIRATLDAWEVPGSAVTVVECMPGHDYTIPTMLGDRLDGATVVPFRDGWSGNRFPVGHGSTWISTRYHPHLLAAAGGDSGIAISSSPDYYATKHRALADAGSRWTIVSGETTEIPGRPVSGGYSPESVRANITAKRALAQRIYPAGARLRR
ncbi:polysaccharide pyruvyl transferase family protein [Gordonia zhaorongruii]|uniref:polysaccharide pyruvyl transferase family protein n=1 Tax=Gordonia zhaorongruii TaxID=2597659 RepID=UPI00104772D6|nr:polysaccharide pyruvyl transferase family protein [Gordonia zhaorongruii]